MTATRACPSRPNDDAVAAVIGELRATPTPPGQRPRATLVPAMSPPVVGSADPDLVIDQISSGVEALIGETAHAVVGRSLLATVEVPDVAGLLGGLAGQVVAGRYLAVAARLRGSTSVSVPGQLVILPRNPAPTCVFTFTPAGLLRPVWDVPRRAQRAPSSPDGVARPAAAGCRALLERLSGRESQIVLRLIRGDRVPAISRELYLTQSTVRNYLSAAYRKLGVSSQQAVIDLFRRAGHDRDTPPGDW